MRRRRGFSLVELLIAITLFLAVATFLFIAMPVENEETHVRRDMVRLERWLTSAMLRSGRWKSSFSLSFVMPQSAASRHRVTLRWQDGGLASQKNETFYAAQGVRWHLQGNTTSVTWRWSTHSLSPALTLSALNSRGKLTGNTLTVSLRGQITRRSNGNVM